VQPHKLPLKLIWVVLLHKSRIWRIPILWISFLRVVVGSTFIKRSATLSLDRIYWILIFLCFSSFWLNENNFGGICFVWSLLMNPSFIWATHAVLSSNSTFGSLLTGNSQVAWMCWVTNLNHTHSRLASWSAMTSAWLEEVTISVCFFECQEIVVPPHVNTYPIWDLTLCGSDK